MPEDPPNTEQKLVGDITLKNEYPQTGDSSSGNYGLRLGNVFLGVRVGADPAGFGLKLPGVLVGGWSAGDKGNPATSPLASDAGGKPA
ncbi:hypothetical protein QQS21_009433 [Conoideocrella luteorostrata]|uniref:Uncharacterized protein n=1 Tax=Conoideocrella luteorostrata TaxID=1105319 RepID=A0AAJ0CLB8_9HYPO|nr:hypothetical protein QQS21_009433 [Conoideocrella luteorostrata]